MSLNELIIRMQGAWQEPLLALPVLLLAAYAAGRGVLRLFRAGRGAHLPALVFGLDLLALLFRVGDRIILLLPTGWLWALSALPAACGAVLLARTLRSRFRRDWPLWLAVLLLAGITAAPAFVPPFSWDEQSYQVALPVRYLAEGSTAVLADNPYSALSSMPHFLMLWGVKLGGIDFPRLLVLACYLIAVPWFYLLLRRFGRNTALAFTAAFLFSPLVIGMWREAYLEPFILLNLMAGAAALRLFRRRLDCAAPLAGFAAGMAAAVKLTGGAASLAVAGMFFAALASDRVPRGRIVRLLWYFCMAALAATIPFYWRPLAATGNPFYPFGAALLDPASSAAAVEVYHSLLGTGRFGISGIESLFSSWILVAFRMEIYDGYLTGWQFPLMLALGAAAWYRAARKSGRRLLPFLWAAGGGALYYLFWCLSSQQSRFLLPFLFPAAFFAASGLALLPGKWRNGALVLIAAGTLFSFQPTAWKNFYFAWRSLEVGRKAPADFLRFATREKEYGNVLDFLARTVPADARTMLIFDRRGLYVPGRCVLGTPCFQEKYFTPVPKTAEVVDAQLRQGGIDYIVILTGGESKRNPDQVSDFDAENERLTLHLLELLKQEKLAFVPIPESGRYRLLKVNR